MSSLRVMLLILLTVFLATASLSAEEQNSAGMPPAKVVVAEITSGLVAPEIEFVGTARYQEVSDIAPEVDGIVEEVRFDEGDRVKRGDVLVKLNADLLKKTLAAARASYEQALSELEQAERELDRGENLYKEQLISDQQYDLRKFAVQQTRKRAAALKADVERHEIELQKKSVRAPYGGLVIRKHVDRGEWLSSGTVALTVAKDDYMAPVVDVPEDIVRYLKKGMIVNVRTGSHELKGMIVAVIPKGDYATRTFPVKVGVKNTISLMEGMEVRVVFPVGEKKEALMVPRDALITSFGGNVVFAVNDETAKMIPVEVIAYQGMTAGIQAEGLEQGMKVVVKGNERLRDGQNVMMQTE